MARKDTAEKVTPKPEGCKRDNRVDKDFPWNPKIQRKKLLTMGIELEEQGMLLARYGSLGAATVYE